MFYNHFGLSVLTRTKHTVWDISFSIWLLSLWWSIFFIAFLFWDNFDYLSTESLAVIRNVIYAIHSFSSGFILYRDQDTDTDVRNNISTILRFSMSLFHTHQLLFSPSPLCLTPRKHNLFFISVILPFLKCYLSGIMQHVTFSNRFISLNIVWCLGNIGFIRRTKKHYPIFWTILYRIAVSSLNNW